MLDRLAFPRDKSGVDAYYTKLASAAVIKSGARWFVDARLWGRNTRWQLRWWWCARPAWMMAQLPSSCHRMHGVGLWLNPAYGSKCKGIEPTLARCVRAVRERGCWLVALLPLYSFKTW